MIGSSEFLGGSCGLFEGEGDSLEGEGGAGATPGSWANPGADPNPDSSNMAVTAKILNGQCLKMAVNVIALILLDPKFRLDEPKKDDDCCPLDVALAREHPGCRFKTVVNIWYGLSVWRKEPS